MFEQCIERMTAVDSVESRSLELNSMSIGKGDVTFVRGRCSNHAMQALDEADDHSSTLTMAELATHLSDAGKYYLLGIGAKPSGPVSPFRQVLTGKIGLSPITILLGRRNTDNTVNGQYFYTKYRKPIALFGRVTGDALELEEIDSADNPLPKIRAIHSGETPKGVWIGAGKHIVFSAGP